MKAGSAVGLIFRNPDNLYHKLVVVNAGALETVGTKADVMARKPDGLDKTRCPTIRTFSIEPRRSHWGSPVPIRCGFLRLTCKAITLIYERCPDNGAS